MLGAGGPPAPRGPDRGRYTRAVLVDHPVALWPLDDSIGSLVARDLSGNNNPATVVASNPGLHFAAPGLTSDGATALQQDQSTTAAQAPNISSTTASIGAGSHAFTLECLAAYYSTDDNGALMGIGTAGAGAGWAVFLRPTTIDFIDITTFAEWSWPHGVVPFSWHPHSYAITYSGSGTPHALVDGVDRGAATTSGVPAINLGAVGLYADSAAGVAWDGRMTLACVAFYDHALSAAQIAAHVAAR